MQGKFTPAARERVTERLECARKVLGSTTDPLTPAQRAEAEQLRLRATQQLARLSLEVKPKSAMVRIDGSAMTSNAGELELNPGRHQIELSGAGFQTASRAFQLRPGHNEVLQLELAPDEPKLTLAAYGTMLGTAIVVATSVLTGKKSTAWAGGIAVGVSLTAVSAVFLVKDVKRRRAARPEGWTRAAVSSFALQALSPSGFLF